MPVCEQLSMVGPPLYLFLSQSSAAVFRLKGRERVHGWLKTIYFKAILKNLQLAVLLVLQMSIGDDNHLPSVCLLAYFLHYTKMRFFSNLLCGEERFQCAEFMVVTIASLIFLLTGSEVIFMNNAPAYTFVQKKSTTDMGTDMAAHWDKLVVNIWFCNWLL